ncbi:hypothetical protein PHSC3_001679 [Chlamydiales bacterium STE3]|nr:hypothetical protein PHSC3_001679 [Chlamydiales bacterium STE3]
MHKLLERLKIPSKELTLHYYHFRFGFELFYGDIEGTLIPISLEDGAILYWQSTREQKPWWPIEDARGNYCRPKISVKWEDIGGSTNALTYLLSSLSTAEWDPSSKAYELLKELNPYAPIIKKEDPELYRGIRKLFPHYPRNP